MSTVEQFTQTTRRFTVDEVLRMVETGILQEDEHVELIEGELIQVSPQGPQHSGRLNKWVHVLQSLYAGVGHIRGQAPLACGADSLPEPDIAVVPGELEAYYDRHPNGDEALLVVEFARTSQSYDRRKAAVYALGGVPEYWVVDLPARRVEVYREPSAGGYRHNEILGSGKAIFPPGLDVSVSVDELVG